MKHHSIHRFPFSGELKSTVEKNALILQRDEDGNIVSPNGTGVKLDEVDTNGGHTHGNEFRYQKSFAELYGMTQTEFEEPSMFGNPALFHIEPESENKSHHFEEKNYSEGMANVTMYAAGQKSDIMGNLYVEQNENSDTVCCCVDSRMVELYTLPRDEVSEVSESEIDCARGCDESAIDFSDDNATVLEDSDEYSYTY